MTALVLTAQKRVSQSTMRLKARKMIAIFPSLILDRCLRMKPLANQLAVKVQQW